MAVCVTAGCVSDAKVIPAPAPKAERRFQVTVPSPVQFSRSMTFHSRISGTNSTNLSFPTSGRIDSLRVKEGDSVEAGDVLATLDAPQLLGTLEQAKAAVATARTDLGVSKQEYERAESLLAQRVLSQQDYTRIKRDYQVAEQRLNDAKASAAQVQNNLSDLNLVAQEAGLITRIHNRPGGFLQAGEPLLRLDSTRRQKAIFEVPEHVAVQVRSGDAFALHIPALDRQVDAAVIERSPPAANAVPMHQITLQLSEADVSMVGLRATLNFSSESTSAYEVDYRAIRYGADHQPYIVKATEPLTATVVRVLGVRNNSAIFTAQAEIQHSVITGSDFSLHLNLAQSEHDVGE